KSKMFCGCDNDITGKMANENICPICLGHPGVLPVANKQAIEWTVLTGLALNCEIPALSKFDRKNYFYPDLPKGYQISQYDQPIAVNGYLETGGHKIRIRRVHLEEDAAKNFHSADKNYSLVDYNRSGTPLLEIVTEPDLETAEEAGDFLRQLRLIMRYLGVSNADMEKGELRCDANVNIKRGDEKTPIVEIKNLNSFKMVEAALAYEIKRQTEEFDALKNKKGKQTAGWDDQSGATRKQRQKEEAEDYRYFPEPDLPLFNLGEIAKAMARKMPELPDQRRARLAEEYGLKQEEINALVNNKTLGDYYEQVVSEALGDSDSEKRKIYKFAANWVVTELQKLLKASNTDISHLKITAENFGEFVNIVSRGEINSSAGQIALSEMFETGADPSQIIADKNLGQVNDVLELEKIAREVIAENPEAVADFQSGNEKIMMFLVGKVMAKTGGRANPKMAQEMLKKNLKSP
ncbi:MAG: Asp-tRNA(Asn)/Glu-tRNA(Gln) amidotransferase subunit GatB, partial [bacterium]|nr:Asp-tRNA(Asn)/Glu-tRNA(Gln) amidotransferase subunit GatB [bacterium]